jgi:2-oxoglutarate dehydrogenase E2 component (dihydrolipoamide succinyltransferase)
VARKLAAENNVDLSKVKGTGNFGRVLPDDVLIFAGKKTVAPPTPVATPATATATAAPKAAGGKAAPAAAEAAFDGVKLMDGMQKAVSKNMEKTLNVPIFRVSR